jgi:hypothetical protein
MAQPSQPTVIPLTPSLPWYRVTVQIADTSYIFDVKWNARDVAWYFDLLELDETPIAKGVKIVLGTVLARRADHPLIKSGSFIAKDLSGQFQEAGFDDLGTRVQLIYFTVYDIFTVVRHANGL